MEKGSCFSIRKQVKFFAMLFGKFHAIIPFVALNVVYVVDLCSITCPTFLIFSGGFLYFFELSLPSFLCRDEVPLWTYSRMLLGYSSQNSSHAA